MSKDTFNRYSKTWLDFIQEQGITAQKKPDQEDFLEYFSKKKAKGHGFNTLRSEYSHINKALKTGYGFNLSKFPKIWDFINSTAKGYVVKKSLVFSMENLEKFFSEIDLTNRFQLVRGAIAAITYLGGNRMVEIKNSMKWKGTLFYHEIFWKYAKLFSTI